MHMHIIGEHAWTFIPLIVQRPLHTYVHAVMLKQPPRTLHVTHDGTSARGVHVLPWTITHVSLSGMYDGKWEHAHSGSASHERVKHSGHKTADATILTCVNPRYAVRKGQEAAGFQTGARGSAAKRPRRPGWPGAQLFTLGRRLEHSCGGATCRARTKGGASCNSTTSQQCAPIQTQHVQPCAANERVRACAGVARASRRTSGRQACRR